MAFEKFNTTKWGKFCKIVIEKLVHNQKSALDSINFCSSQSWENRGSKNSPRSPTIFKLFSEAIFWKALECLEARILLNAERLNIFKYADDTVIFADTAEKLQLLMNKVDQISRNYGLGVNTTKSKVMIISNERIEEV